MSNSIKTDDVIFNFFKQICDEKDEITARLAQGVANFVAHDDIEGLAHLLGEFLGEKRTVLLASYLTGNTSCHGKVNSPGE